MAGDPNDGGSEPDGEELVITPGGPRPKDQVHGVGPGQVIRRTPEGTYIIVDEAPAEGEAEGKRRSSVMADEEMVITPGGLRPKSKVHLIESGTILDGAGGRHRKLQANGQVLADFGVIEPKSTGRPLMPDNIVHPQAKAPGLGSGWITYASWLNTGAPISLFSTQWVVPPPPSTQSGQLIYIFSGIQNQTMIYQPVLQWGSSPAGGGNFWAVASWYVDGQGGLAFHTNAVQVNPGQVLTGVMTLSSQSPQGFSYNCQFTGIANTSLPISNVQQLTWCIETLECYGITKCSDYPNTKKTQMSAINMQTGNVHPVTNWTPTNTVTDCGQHTLLFDDDSAGSGEVDLWYSASPFWTSGFGSIAPGASQDWWFAWGGNGDQGPQLIQAEPLNTSGELATIQTAEVMNGSGQLGYHATVKNLGATTVNFQWRGGGR